MNAIHKALFTVIAFLEGQQEQRRRSFTKQSYCDNKHQHDLYCDAEKPFVANF